MCALAGQPMIPVSADAPQPDEIDDDEEDACTCDFDEPENCPVHYPIDDGSEDDEMGVE